MSTAGQMREAQSLVALPRCHWWRQDDRPPTYLGQYLVEDLPRFLFSPLLQSTCKVLSLIIQPSGYIGHPPGLPW